MSLTGSLVAAELAAPRGRIGARRPRGRRRRPENTRPITVVLFLVPFFTLFAAIVIVPLGYAAYMSTTSQSSSGLGFGGQVLEFVGTRNYARVLGDPGFWASLGHVAAYCAVYIPTMVMAAIVFALLLDSAYAALKRAVQLSMFLPYAVPGLVASIIWIYLYTPGLSPVIDLLETVGAEVDFFGGDAVLGSMVNIACWQWVGYNMIIFFAALQAVDREVIEAARMDGAGEIRIAAQIKIPSIRSSVVLVALFTSVGAIQLFTEPQLLSQRTGSVGASWSPVMYIYTLAFSNLDYGRAAAASILLAVVAGVLSFAITKLGNKWRTA